VRSRSGPSGSSGEHERFARALEAAEREAPHDPGEAEDEFSAELAVVDLLRGSREELDADELTRARMRSRVLASSTDARHARNRRPGRGSLRGRLAGAAAAVLCLALALAGLGALGSHTGGPRDSLGGGEPATQHASAESGGDHMSQGIRYTELASSRVDAAGHLLRRGSGSAKDYKAALDTFDSEVRAAARSFHDVDPGSRVSALRKLHDWSARAAARLSGMREDVPPRARGRLAASAALCRRVAHRAQARLRELQGFTPRSSGAAQHARSGSGSTLPSTQRGAASRQPATEPGSPRATPSRPTTQRPRRDGAGRPHTGTPRHAGTRSGGGRGLLGNLLTGGRGRPGGGSH
jgi:hypothetical protein